MGDNADLGSADPPNSNPIIPLIVRDNPDTSGPDSNYLHFTGDASLTLVLGGTPDDNILIAGDSDDDTVWRDAGNDRIDGGYDNNRLRATATTTSRVVTATMSCRAAMALT